MMADRPRTKAVYVISVAAELAGMHPQTLRIYERRGLVSPARTQGGNRRYSDQDIAGAAASLEGATELDALIAYLQMLGTGMEETP